jgi:hypothetical protein
MIYQIIIWFVYFNLLVLFEHMMMMINVKDINKQNQ